MLRPNDHRLLRRQAEERHESEPRSGAQPPVTDASSSCKLKSAAGLRQVTSGTHFQDSPPFAPLTINVHAVPRPALACTRHDPFFVVHFEQRKSRKEEGVATHHLLAA